MREYIDNILQEIESEINSFDLYGYDIISNSLKMIDIIQKHIDQLRERVIVYEFGSQEEEIIFFKELKPQILSKQLYFNKIYCIESKFPTGSNEAAKKYLNDQLHSLEYYFNRHLDFHQYYRSGSTVYDKYYFVRGDVDPKLCTDSSRFNSDLKFSTVYDFKVAKIIANEMLRIYLNRRLKMIEDPALFTETKKGRRTWTGQKNALIELGYSLYASGDIDHGNIDVKEIMDTLGEAFNVDLGEYYRTYIALRSRKKDQTAYLNSLIEKLKKKMDEDDTK
ncbi:RteC domain-containing protein [Bacteroides sp.]|uniref:RteC domain-containing protein n=1 Tax=Bacteroides sp. TaxID=29523 RepID=UPI00262F39A2|nr:RteC domain-containing protein [Bacteroides sp.]MDD3039503.1 RteC domain-containing protein [Bacteroides sp.]